MHREGLCLIWTFILEQVEELVERKVLPEEPKEKTGVEVEADELDPTVAAHQYEYVPAAVGGDAVGVDKDSQRNIPTTHLAAGEAQSYILI